jgi:hypothetical protein
LSKVEVKEVFSLDEAYELGYFQGSITRDELLDRITKKNPDLRLIYGKEGVGLFSRNKYVASIGKLNPIPKFTLSNKVTGKVYNKSYISIIDRIRRQGYEVIE